MDVTPFDIMNFLVKSDMKDRFHFTETIGQDFKPVTMIDILDEDGTIRTSLIFNNYELKSVTHDS